MACPDFGRPNDFIQTDWLDVKDNPDVAGIGVLVGFVATAYMALVIICIYFFAGYISSKLMNRVDKIIIDAIRRKSPTASSQTWEVALHRAVLMFSDQQIVTGIALLVTGYAQLPHGLSAIHWQMIIYLAWFSSITHLTTLTLLRQHFSNNPAARLWRVVLMFIMITMLVIALLPTGDGLWFGTKHSDNLYTAGVPAMCYFRRLVARSSDRFTWKTDQTLSMVLSIAVLLVSYLTRLVKMSSKATSLIKLWGNQRPGKAMRKSLNQFVRQTDKANDSLFGRWKHLVLEMIYIFLKASFDAYGSTFWEILWLCFALARGTVQMKNTRAALHEFKSGGAVASQQGVSKGNDWEFGQLLPVILLLLPLCSVAQNYFEQRGMIRGNQVQTGNVDGDDSRHQKSQSMEQEQFLRVGQWVPTSSAIQIASQLASENRNVSRRTGTDLQNEELNMTSVDFTSGPGHAYSADIDSSLSFNHACTVPQEALETTDNPASSSVQHYYQFEGFRILIGQMLLMTSFVIITIIYYLSASRGKVVEYWLAILLTVFCEVVLLVFYIATFVLLTHYHGNCGKFGERWTGVSRPTQRKLLRISAYVYVVGAMIALSCVLATELSLSHHTLRVYPPGAQKKRTLLLETEKKFSQR